MKCEGKKTPFLGFLWVKSFLGWFAQWMCEGSPRRSPCRLVSRSPPHWRPSSFEFPGPLLGVPFCGLVFPPGSRYGRFISHWTVLGTSIAPVCWEQSNALHGQGKCSRCPPLCSVLEIQRQQWMVHDAEIGCRCLSSNTYGRQHGG